MQFKVPVWLILRRYYFVIFSYLAKTCPHREAPINGALSRSFVSGFGHMFQASCQNPYTFNGPVAYSYVCTLAGYWTTIPPKFPNKWPDCTGTNSLFRDCLSNYFSPVPRLSDFVMPIGIVSKFRFWYLVNELKRIN